MLDGIANGIDTSEWSPSTDEHLPARYSADDMSGARPSIGDREHCLVYTPCQDEPCNASEFSWPFGQYPIGGVPWACS